MSNYDRKAKRPERLKNRVGERYGKLLIEERIERSSCVPLWRCICDCGREHIATFYSLRKSCSCSSCNDSPRGVKPKKVGEIPQAFLSYVKKTAELKSLEFDLSLEFLSELFESQERKCALSGVPLVFNFPSSGTASLDRKDSSKGYTQSNTQWVHKEINLLKRNFKNEDFISICVLVSSFNKNYLKENFDLSSAREGSFWKTTVPRKERKRSGVLPREFPAQHP